MRARPLFRDWDVPGTEEAGRPYKNHTYAAAATPSGELLLAAPGPEYLILRVDRSGDVSQVIRRPEIEPLRRSEAEIEALRERVKKAFAALGREPPASLRVPMYRTHVSRLTVAPDASIWALTQRGDSSAAIIDRFDAGGRFSASYTVELRVSELSVSSDAVFFLARSALDVPGIGLAARR